MAKSTYSSYMSFEKIIDSYKGNSYVNNDINDNNDNNNYNINDNNVTNKKYRLNRKKFTPNTKESTLAEEIATKFNDLDNFAAFYKVVNELGYERSLALFKSVCGEIDEKKGTYHEVRNPPAYFMWRYKKRLLV